MQNLPFLLSNPLVNISLLSWAIAQFLKTVLYWFTAKHFDWERIVGAGGMPSSHSAFVVSLTIGTARLDGFSSSNFALSIAFAAVVMYDAMGVRRAAGEQAKTLNYILESYQSFWDGLMEHPLLGAPDANDSTAQGRERSEAPGVKVLKEFLGHTPLEVLAGAFLGILVGALYPLG